MARPIASPIMRRVLIIGSGPNATEVQSWHLSKFHKIIVINNAWRVTEHWTDLIYPYDFPSDRLPEKLATGQRLID